MTQKLTAAQRVQKQHVWLMGNPEYCLYSGLFVFGKTEVVDDVATACTDGVNVKYGTAFVDGLDDRCLRGLILHETLHKAFRHTTVWRHLYKKKPLLANMACDYVINLLIVDSDPSGKEVALPEGVLLDEKYRGMDAGEIYKMLDKTQKEKRKGNGEGGSGDDQGSQESAGFDEHDWEASDKLSEQEREDMAREVDQALRQGALLAGRLKGNVPRGISELLGAKINWREVLRDFVSSFADAHDSSTWRRPNRRWVDQDVYMPSSVSETMGEMVVAIDTSGSIGQDQLSQFLGEVMAICRDLNPERVHLLYWDTGVAQHETYEQGQYESMLQSTKPKGGGGTDVVCVPAYIKAKSLKPECVLVLTDGYLNGDWGVWGQPVFWGITEKNIQAGVGVSVYVGD